jgi:hypothetical protein
VTLKATGAPLGVDVIFGLILIPVSAAAVTVRLAAGEVMLLFAAVIVVLPCVRPVATPVLLLMLAIAGAAVAQTT